MKPKDLLVHLEKGDRTMFHLTKRRGVSSQLSQAFTSAFGASLGNTLSQHAANILQSQNAMWSGNQMTSTTMLNPQGGILRW